MLPRGRTTATLGQRPHHDEQQRHHEHPDRTAAAAVTNVGLQRAAAHQHSRQPSDVRSVGAAYDPTAAAAANVNARGGSSSQRGLSRLENPAAPLGQSAVANHPYQPQQHLVESPNLVKPPGHGRRALRTAFVDRTTASSNPRAALEGTATSTASDESSTQAPALARLRSEDHSTTRRRPTDDDDDPDVAASFDLENVDPHSRHDDGGDRCGSVVGVQKQPATPTAPAQRSASRLTAPSSLGANNSGSSSGGRRRRQHAVLHDTPHTPSDGEPTQPVFGSPMDAIAEDRPHLPVHPTPPAGAKPVNVGRHRERHIVVEPAAAAAVTASSRPVAFMSTELALQQALVRLTAAHGPGEVAMGAALEAKGLSVPVLRQMLSTPTPAMAGELFSRIVGRILRRHKGFAIEPLPPSVYHMFPCYSSKEFRDPNIGLGEVMHRLLATYATAEPTAWLVVLWYMARLAAVADTKAAAAQQADSQQQQLQQQVCSPQRSAGQQHRVASPRYCVSRAAGDVDRLPSITSPGAGVVVNAGGPGGSHRRRFKHHELVASTTRGIPAMATSFDPRFAGSFTVALYAMSECAIGDYSCYARFYTHEGPLRRYRCPTAARREGVCPWDLSAISKRQWLAAEALQWRLVPSGRDLADLIARFCSIDEAAAAVRYSRVEAE